MQTDMDADTDSVATPPSPTKKGRLQSSVQFPYGDLETAIEVVTAMHHGGYRDCAPDQLAGAMRQRVSSGNFRQKVSAARSFGLVDTAPGRISMTDLGHRILDPTQQKKARADAFLSVELYKKLYDDYRGNPLPPRPAALERTFEAYGVSPKQTDKARQVFDRSAKQAGFFDHGNDKLIMPGGLDAPSHPAHLAKEAAEPPTDRRGGGGGGEIPPYLDPLIVALLNKIPEGNKWPMSDRARWLRALAMNLSFVYEAEDQDAGEIQVSVQPNTTHAS